MTQKTKKTKTTSVISSINDLLEGTRWSLLKKGRPRKISLKKYRFTQLQISDLMNHYRSAGWIVKASVEINTKSTEYTLEFINPHYI